MREAGADYTARFLALKTGAQGMGWRMKIMHAPGEREEGRRLGRGGRG